MGYYTKFDFKAKFRKDSPAEFIDLIDKIVNRNDELWIELTGKEHPPIMSVYDTPNLPIDHKFGKCHRWNMLFFCEGWSTFDKDKRILIINSNLKNYGGEIEKFIDWISPYVAGHKPKQFVGTRKGEDPDSPQINIYIERNSA